MVFACLLAEIGRELFLKFRHSSGIAGAQPTAFSSSTTVYLLGNPWTSAGLSDRYAIIAVQLRFPQLDDDLLDSVILSCHLFQLLCWSFFSLYGS